MGTALLPDSDNQKKLYDSDKEIADLEKLYHSDSAETSGSDIARQKEIDALNNAYNMPGSLTPTTTSNDGEPTGNNPGDMSKPRDPKDNPKTFYTGNGETPQKKTFGKRVRNVFASGNPNRLRNMALFSGLGVFLAGIVIVIVILSYNLAGIHIINASRLLMGSFGIAANQASETYARIAARGEKDTSKSRLSVDRDILSKKLRPILKNAGIDFTYDTNTGRALSAHLDPTKNPDLTGKSEGKLKSYLAEKYNLATSDITINRSGSGFEVELNMRNKPIKIQEGILKDFATRTDRGKVLTLLVARHFRQSLEAPSLFHPFQRANAATKNAVGRYIDVKIRENERLKEFKTKMDAQRSAMRDFFSQNSGKITAARVSGSLILLLCAVKEISTSIEQQNYTAYVQPAQQSALDMIAQGDQVAYGDNNDYTADQVDSAAAHMYGTYQGQTYSFFDAANIRAQEGLPPVTFKDSAAQAQYNFDRQSLASAFSDVSPWQTAYDYTTTLGSKMVCQTPIVEFLTIADIGITISSAFATGGVGAAFKAAVSTGVTMGAVSLVMSMIVAGSENKLPDITPNQGLLGGELAGYGSDSAANASSATAGAAKVSAERAKKLKQEAINVDLSMAKQQSIAQKLSPTNIHSPVAKLVNGIHPSPTENMKNVASSFANIFASTLRLPLTLFSARAHADSSSSSSSAPTLALTAAVEKKVDESPLDTILADTEKLIDSGTNGYAQRAGICFGVKFLDSTDSSGASYFDIQYDHQVDYYAVDYRDANCEDEKDGNWVTVSAAVHVIAVADAAVCRETGDDEACGRTGTGTTTTTLASDSTDTSGAIGEPNTSTGRSQGSWGGYSNGNIPLSAMTKITPSFLGVSASDTIQICDTNMSDPYLNPNAAVSIKALNDAFKQKYGHMIYFQSCYRDIAGQKYAKAKYGSGAATVGKSNHGWGLAVDVGPNPKKDQGCDSDSSNLTSAEKEMCQWLTDNAPKYGWKNGKDVVPGEQWHFEYSRTLPTTSGAGV